MLAAALQGVVAQQLLPTSDGRGRIAAVEVLLPTPAVRNLIREGKTHQIYSAIQTGGEHGMQTMDAALVDLVQRGRITIEAARRRASMLPEFERLMADGKPALASSQVLAGASNGYLQ
jgi:twitching motility protein PilT